MSQDRSSDAGARKVPASVDTGAARFERVSTLPPQAAFCIDPRTAARRALDLRLFYLQELHARRVWDTKRRYRVEAAGLVVDPELDEIAAKQVCNEEIVAGWIDQEMFRRLAVGRGVFNRRQSAFGRIDCENRDAVMSPVRSIEESAIWMYKHFRADAGAVEIFGQAANGVYWREGAALAIPTHGRDVRSALSIDVTENTVRMKTEVSRVGTRG